MDTKEFLKEISGAYGVSGYEHEVGKIVKREFSKYADEVKEDKLGNIIALKKGQGKSKIMYAAHMDEIGLIVTDILEGGFLKFTQVGGYDQRTLIAQEVIVHGKEEVLGVIGLLPPHLTSFKERTKSIPMKDMMIDTGYEKEELEKLVKVGDIVAIKRELIELLGESIAGKSFDDRAGVAALFDSIKDMQNYKHDADIYYVITVQEEVGIRGAKTSSYAINPDIAVAVDVSFAKTQDIPDYKALKFEGGPSLAMGPNIHPKVFETLKQTAEDFNIDYQVDINYAGHSGTDAYEMQIARAGLRTAVISIPLRYMHTSVETISMKDVKSTSRLLTEYIISFNDKDMEDLLCF